MLTDQDIAKLVGVLATQKDLNDLKSNALALKDDVRNLQASVDNLAKMVKDFRDEHIVVHRRLETLEAWAKKVSEKVGIPLPF